MAIPICSLAAATCRSALAMSGLRSRSSDGTPSGTGGGDVVNVTGGIVSSAGALPIRMAMACSNAAR